MILIQNPLIVSTADGDREYQVGRAPLGGGGFGTVWRGRDKYDAEFAVKLIPIPTDPEERADVSRAFAREVKALRSVHHQNVVGYRTHGTVEHATIDDSEGQALALVTGFVDGPTLRELIGPTGLAPSLIRALFAQVCAGLDAMHVAHLVHRDLKPENIVLDRHQQLACLVDLGLGRNPTTDPLSDVSGMVGTQFYLAPEQLMPGSPLTPRTDLYSLALVVFETLSGRRAFGDELSRSMERRRSGDPPDSLGPFRLGVFDEFFRVALAADPHNRFVDAASWFEAFEQAAAAANLERLPLRVESPKTTAASIVLSEHLVRWEDYREQFLKAIGQEIVAVRQDLARRGADKPIQARGLHRVGRAPDGAEYEVEVAAGLTLAEETPFRADVDGHYVNGHIIQVNPETGDLRLWLEEDRGPEIAHASLQFDAVYLLERLADRLNSTPGYNRNLWLGLAALRNEGTTSPVEWSSHGHLNESQERAIRTALGSAVSYIWGPPGTGKTRTVAALVRALAESGRRVVVVAPTNVATDAVAEECLRSTSGEFGALIRDGLVVRYGEQSMEIRRGHIAMDSAFESTVKRELPNLAVGIEALWKRYVESELPDAARGRRQRDADVTVNGPTELRGKFYTVLRTSKRLAASESKADGLAEVLARAETLQAAVEEAEHFVLRRAHVVFTTLTKLYLGGRLADITWDDAIVDEASMAAPPMVVVAGTTARERLIIAGDFLQLPPVVVSQRAEARQWLGRDVFVLAGVDGTGHIPTRCMLEEQYRMHPEISSVVSRVFYRGRLRDGESVRQQYPAYFGKQAPPAPRNVLLVLDTTAANPISEKPSSGSRRNEVHAQCVVNLIQAAANIGLSDIGVIAPYVAQARLIRERARELNHALFDVAEIATVHRFQGREKELIIFDTTDAPPVPSGFLNDRNNAMAKRLVNVAVSRARRRLVILATAPWLVRQLTQQASLLQVLRAVRQRGSEYDLEPWPGAELTQYFSDTMQDLEAPTAAVDDWIRTLEIRAGYVKSIEGRELTVLTGGREISVPAEEVTYVCRDGIWYAVKGGEA